MSGPDFFFKKNLLIIFHLPNEKLKLQISNRWPLILVAIEWEFGLVLIPTCSTFEAVSECWMDESWTDTDGSRQGTNKNDHKLEPFFSALPWGRKLQAPLSSEVLLLEVT